MYLVDDIDAVLADLRWYAHLINQGTDVLDGVVGRGVKLVDIEGALLVECLARLALVASLVVGRRVETVDSLSEDTRTGGLTNTTRTAKEVGVCETIGAYSVAQRLRERLLTYYTLKSGRTILSG